jgi:hypothetical protein
VVDGVNLLRGRRQEEAVHLRLEGVVDLDVDVVARGLFLVGVPHVLHVDHVIDDLHRGPML